MPCFAPLQAYRTRAGGITFTLSASMSGEHFYVPCGQCVGCRLEKSRQWAMRCMHEKRLWPRSSFLTLTYDDVHLPAYNSLNKRDLQLFMKRLRKVREPSLVRFYACGEYGELTKRPHYHVLLFNCDFADKTLFTENGRGDVLYRSDELRRLWPLGHHLVGDVTFQSAAYVARYVVKKMTGELADRHYEVVDPDGVVHERVREFALMSRRPGIGSGYYERYGSEVRDHDSVVVDGRECPPPRFYDSRTEGFSPAVFDIIRKKRKLRAARNGADNRVDRRRVKEYIAERRLADLDKARSV